jgi:nucleotide-binding universal stress UspA family protein
MFENILVCLDGSKSNEAILPFVEELAGRFNSKVLLLNVVIVPAILAGFGQTEIEQCQSIQSGEQEEGIDYYLENLAGNLRERGLDVVCVAVEGTIEESILAFARTNEIGLIAMATHHHLALVRFVLGSTTDIVIRKSGIPVLVLCPDNSSILRA